MFGIELGVPFFIFLPRRPCLFAFWILAAFQLLITLTGNYTFFNLLTFALCLLLLDDVSVRGWIPQRGRAMVEQQEMSKFKSGVFPRLHRSAAWLMGSLILLASIPVFTSTLRARFPWPRPLIAVCEIAGRLRSANSYGLF